VDGFADASFDAAVSTMALMNSPDLSGAARAVFRILRPRGRFFFSVLHPCFWTRASRWVNDADEREHGILVTDYWVDEPYVEEFRFEGVSASEAPPFVVPRFPYRLEDYINCLADVGFRITGVLEPRPTVEMAAAYPTLLGPLRKHAPIVLYIGAAKP
jgi:SAM-dependent methyltransferase